MAMRINQNPFTSCALDHAPKCSKCRALYFSIVEKVYWQCGGYFSEMPDTWVEVYAPILAQLRAGNFDVELPFTNQIREIPIPSTE